MSQSQTSREPEVIAGRLLAFLILAFLAIVAVYPIVFMGLSSFRTSVEYLKDPLGWPNSFRYTDNYVSMRIRYDIPRLFANTALYILLATLVTLSAAVPAAFAFAKLHFRFSYQLRLMMIGSLIVPAITVLIPNYVFLARVGLVDTMWSVVLLWSAFAIPGNIFLLSSLMRALPNELLEAARLDGASYLELLRRIVVPLSVPGLITVSIFNVTAWWNDLLIPLVFLQTEEQMTVTVGMATVVGRFSTDYPQLLTGLFLASLPPIAVYVLLQRFIRRGLVIGAVK